MKVKTYGVPELTEWQGKLKAGSIEVNVLFTGGTASPSGAQPAYFVTKDPITQFVIENSKEFKDGFIILMMQTELPGVHPRMAIPKPHEEVQGEQPKPATEQTLDPMAVKTNENEVHDQDEDAGEGACDANKNGDDAPAGDQPIVVKVSVCSKTEAIEWLKDHYPDKGYNGFKLKGKSAFEAACNECNVVFDIQG